MSETLLPEIRECPFCGAPAEMYVSEPEREVQAIDDYGKLVEALRSFCRRVDAGEIRSRRAYEEFRAIISKADKSRPLNILFRRGEWSQYTLIRPIK